MIAHFFFRSFSHKNYFSQIVVGKAEGKDESWHGHVTAVTVASEFRRLGLARLLMNILEVVSEKM